eukprot:1402549-Lingulodinium_polyedra.AAC.1
MCTSRKLPTAVSQRGHQKSGGSFAGPAAVAANAVLANALRDTCAALGAAVPNRLRRRTRGRT